MGKVKKLYDEMDTAQVGKIEVAGIKKGRHTIKTKIEFDISLNPEQKLVKANILANDTISIITGRGGSGKTLLAAQIALEMLFYREVDRIIITRPMISDEEIGFLPGDIEDKFAPWIAPIMANMQLLCGKEKVKKLVETNQIEVVPFTFIRGRTFLNSIVIGDEFQNASPAQIETFLTRLGTNSKMIICGDLRQTDLRSTSGLAWLLQKQINIDGVSYYDLKTNNRHPILDKLFDVLESH